MADITLTQVEERLVACHELWRRSPGNGPSPFASDGPWHLIRPEAGDIVGHASTTILDTGRRTIEVMQIDTARRPRTPLDAAEVTERDRVTLWVQLVSDPLDRALVHHATFRLHLGEGRVPWTVIGRGIGSGLTRKGLEWRYRKGIAAIAGALNGWTARRIRAEASAWVRPDPLEPVSVAHWDEDEGESLPPAAA